MKRMLKRLSILLLLSTAVVFVSQTNDARAFDCVDVGAMWDAMSACDDNFWNGASNHYDVVQNNPNHCHQYAAAQCQSLLGQPGYDACYNQAYNQCVSDSDGQYSNAIDSYSSCLSAAENPGCFERMDFCAGAIDRANLCEQFADDPSTAYSSCRNASGVSQCQ